MQAFQFTASYEADRFLVYCYKIGKAFQFTASYEADQKRSLFVNELEFFQFTASYEADLENSVSQLVSDYLSIHSLIRG